MSDLTAARDWVRRARELLRLGTRSERPQEFEALGLEFEQLMKQSSVQELLPPDLGLAMGQLAQTLGSELNLSDELSSDQEEEKELVENFRVEFVRLQTSLAPVFSPAEASSFELALELADGQAGVRQFAAAMRVLQQAWHRLTGIRDEGRSGALALGPAVDDRRERREQERQKRIEDMQPRLTEASQRVAHSMARLEPLSPEEKLQCSQYSIMLLQLMGRDRLEDALELLESWTRWLDEVWNSDSENRTKHETAIDNIEHAASEHETRLRELSRLLTYYNRGGPHAMESRIGPAVFEVSRQLQRLRARPTRHERDQRAFAKVLVTAKEALKTLAALRGEAATLLEKAQNSLIETVDTQEKALSEYRLQKTKDIESQRLDVERREHELVEHGKTSLKLTDVKGKKLDKPLSPTSEKFYREVIAQLDPKENPPKGKKATITEEEKKALKVARAVVAACETNARLEKALSESSEQLKALEEERDKGLLEREAKLESTKLPQHIRWAAPDAITYGTPLGKDQLNASLSANNGTIEYRFGGKPIEIGKTLLPAGTQELEAVVIGGDSETFQSTPPKRVTIEVAKAKVTLACSPTLEVVYGTPFSAAALSASVSTEPSSPGEHEALLALLTYLADGKPMKDKQRLDAKAWTLKVRCPGNANFEPSNEVEVALTVKPAPLEIIWEGAAPTTFTFGTGLVAQQLNASVRVTSDPPLKDRWAELTQALQYVDEKDQPVALGTELPAGEVRRVTARTPPAGNFIAAKPKSVEFKVEKASRTLSTGTPPAIGAVVQKTDLKKLAGVYKLTSGKGEVEFSIGKVALAVGAKLTAGKPKLKVALKDDDNYLPTPAQEHEIEVQGFAEKFDSAKLVKNQLLTKKVHTKHTQAVDLLQQQIESIGAATDEDKFAKVNALLEEIEEIEANLLTWQGPVRSTQPKGDSTLLEVKTDLPETATPTEKHLDVVSKTILEVMKFVKHGGMKLADVEKLVPSGTANVYVGTNNYPHGFRYEWTTPSGVAMVVYGHRGTVASNVPSTSDSKKGNLVRVMINGNNYLKPDGKLAEVSTESTSHMALY